jgi:hypothetical protein
MAGLINDLPPQVKILTLKLLSNNKLLLRVEHIFQTAENDAVVNVDLTVGILFKKTNIKLKIFMFRLFSLAFKLKL